MNQAQNHGIVLPYKCVGFFPYDEEVIDLFLTPWIKKKDIQHCLIQAGDLYPIISGEAGPWDIKTYPYFKRNHYWFFVEREPVKRGSGLVAQRRVLGPYGKLLGTWKSLSANRIKIKKGRLVLGFKQKLEFITNNDLNSGWYQIEYTRYSSKAFETTVVSHLVYDEDKDQVRQHENQENGKEDFVRDLAHKIKTETKIKIETDIIKTETEIKIETDIIKTETEIKTETGALLAHEIKIETGALAGKNGFRA